MDYENEFAVGDRLIGDGHPPYVIGEIGSNHNQNLTEAKELIHAASEAGADAVKFQSLKYDELYLDDHTEESFREFFQNIRLKEDWYEPLADTCKQAGVHFLSSPTYPRAIELLDEQNVPAYKLASAQVGTDDPLLRKVFSRNKPVFLSAGLSDKQRLERVMELAADADNPKLVLLHCVSMYPAPPEKLNLRLMQTYQRYFDCLVGFSDHSIGDYAAVSAVSLGASVIEKHITFDRNQDGPDHHFSQEIPEFNTLVDKIHKTNNALGDSDHWSLHPEEEDFLDDIRLGCVAGRTIQKGETISRSDLEFYRIETGIDVRKMNQIIGCKTTSTIEAQDVLRWDDLEHES
jgi:sialic acid synthase SpsE